MMAVARKESMMNDLAPESFLHRHRSLGPASARHQSGTELYGKWRGGSITAAMLECWWLIPIYISMDYDKIRQIFDYCEDANTWPYHYHQIGIITGYTSIHIVWGN